MTTHVEAKAILERAVPGIDPCVSLLVRTISMLESQYGDGWGHGLSTAGVGSHNWGAIQATDSWSGDTFQHQDSQWNPETQRQEPYVWAYRSYPTPEAGARDLYAVLTGSWHGKAAQLARAGRWGEISAALGPEGSYYYGGFGPPAQAVATHRSRFLERMREIQAATGERPTCGRTVTRRARTVGGLVGAVVLGIGVALFSRRRRGRA